MSDDLAHVHQYGRAKPIVRDYCHYQRVERVCTLCAKQDVKLVERNFNLNPLQITFADSGCQRCRELARGNEPSCWRHCWSCGLELGSGEFGRCTVCVRKAAA